MKNNTPRLDGVLFVFRMGFSRVLGGYKVLEKVQRINGAIPLPASSLQQANNPNQVQQAWTGIGYTPQPSPCPSCGHCPTCGRYRQPGFQYGQNY